MAKRPQNKEEKEERASQKEKEARNQKILNDQLREADKIIGNILEKEDLSLETYADKLQLQAQLTENATIQATLLKRITDLEGSNVKNADLLKDKYTLVSDLVGKVSERYAEVVQNSQNIVSDSFQKVDITQEYNDLLDQEYELDELRDKIGKKEYDRLKEMLDLAKQKLDVIHDTNKSQEIANKLADNYLHSNTLVGASTKGLLHSLESFKDLVGTGSLGIVGEVLGNKAGKYIEEIESDIQGKIVKAFQESGESAISAFSVAKMAFGSFISFALPALGILGLLGIIGGLVHLASHLDEELSEVGKSFGVSRKEAEEIHLSAKGIAKEMKIVGLNSAEVTEAIKETSAALGGLDIMERMNAGSDATKQLVKDVSILGDTFGITDAESGGLSSISDFSIIMGKSIGQVAKESVKLGKGLFTAKQSILTIGKISPSIAIAFKKGSIELLKAAQRAKLLGIELDDVADFGDRLLEIETSLEAEMTARVITGRQLNFDAARQYALQGDIASLQEEMLRQLGSMSEFQSMNRLQQKYMAEAFGMTVDEVAKLLSAQERLVELGIDQTKMDQIQTMNAAELADEMKNASNEKLRGYLQTLAKEKESAALNERISDSMKKMKERIAGTLAPLLEQVHHFLDSAEGAKFLENTTKIIETTLKAIVPVVKFLAENMWILGAALATFIGYKTISGISGIIGLFKGAGGAAAAAKPAVDAFGGAFGDLATQMGTATDATNTMTQAVGGAGGGANALGGFLSSLSTTAVNMAIVAIGLIAFAGALWITAKAFQEFNKVDFSSFLMGIGAMAALAGVAFLLAKSVPAMIIAAGGIKIFALALLGIGAGIALAGFGIKMASESIGILADGFKKLKGIGDLSSVGGTLKKGFDSIIDVLDTVVFNYGKFGKLREAVNQLGIDQLVKFGELAKVDLGKAADNIVNAINSFSKTTFDAIDFGKSGPKWWQSKMEWSDEQQKMIKKTGTGLIGALEQLNDAVGELELDNIEKLAKIATTDMSKLGENVEKAIKSLATINVGDAINNLANVEYVFSKLHDALMIEGMGEGGSFGQYDNYLNPLKDLADFDMKKVVDSTRLLKDVIYNLADIGAMTKLTNGMTVTTGLDNLSQVLIKLSEVLDNLNIDKLKDLSSVNVENLRNLTTALQKPITVNTVSQTTATTPGNSSTTGAAETEESKMNKKFDQMISILTNIFNTANQPVVIKMGDRTIETIGQQLQTRKLFNMNANNAGAITQIR
jgi:hypothetical protein